MNIIACSSIGLELESPHENGSPLTVVSFVNPLFRSPSRRRR